MEKFFNELKSLRNRLVGAPGKGVTSQDSGVPREWERHYRLIVESAQDIMFVVNREFRVEYVNPFGARQFAPVGGRVEGRLLSELFPPEVASRMCANLEKVIATGQPLAVEGEFHFPGRTSWLSSSLIPIADATGYIRYVMGVSRDITERKRLERTVTESEEIYNVIVESTSDCVGITDLDGKIIKVSRRMLSMLGYPDERELIGRYAYELFPTEDRERVLENVRETLVVGYSRPTEHELLRKDGSRFCAECNATLVKDPSGKPKGIVAFARDVTERKNTAEALLQSEKRFKELWDNAPVAYHTLDTNGIITSVNSTEAHMLGYTVEEMLGKPIFTYVLPEQRQEARERFQQKLKEQAVTKSENRIYLRKDGSRIHVSIEDALERDVRGNITGVRTTIIDVTERKKAEDELKKSYQRLEQAMESIVQAMAKIVEMKDPYTAGHQRRVAQLACAIGREMGLPPDQINGIHMASLIHDIGKIYVPSEILSKPGRLTEIEFGMIKTHPKVSYDILKMMEFPWPIAKIVIQHHERLDGSGYPLGLSGEDILLEAKILSIADVIEAIAFHRPYRSAVGIKKAIEEVEHNAGVLYDRPAVEACLRLFRDKGFTFE